MAGLSADQLVGPGDLAVTTDYRDVLAEVCQKRLNNLALGEIFPAYNATVRDFLKPAAERRSARRRPAVWPALTICSLSQTGEYGSPARSMCRKNGRLLDVRLSR